jgi:mannose-1-phosphate guanylyltransferase
MPGHFHAVIPAGGSGTRLWPLSRASRPKFLLPLPGPRTMLQETVSRLLPLCGVDCLSVITGAAHAVEVARQLPELDADRIIVEPMARGSGPAIGLGAAIALQRDPDAIVGSFAADHVVRDSARFESAVRAAIETARAGYLVTIGIEPSYAETGYGYIRTGDQLAEHAGISVSHVEQFKEKPDRETAESYLASGRYLWNSSMFVWRADALLEEMRVLLPELAATLETIAAAWSTPERDDTFQRLWPGIEDVTIDHGILERSDRVAVVPGSFDWTDLGDWHGFGKVLCDDPRENLTLNADVLTHHASGNVVFGNGRTVAIVGLDDVVVVDTADALLVCNRHQAQDVKRLVDDLKRRGSTDLI